MTKGKPTDYQSVVEALLACGPLKTWSLIVTILGDLAAGPGTRVPGPVLTALAERMGLRPEALRVAIHRLRRDGWLTSDRDGRTSLYGLTAHGRALTLSVSDRVYGARVPPPGAWRIVLAPTADLLESADLPAAVTLGRTVALLPGEDGDGDVPAPLLAWPVVPGVLPDWARDLVIEPDLAAAYDQLAGVLSRLAAMLTAAPDAPAPLDAAVLRLLGLHTWRRLVLRHGAGAEALMGDDWPGAHCRAAVVTLLESLDRPDPAALAEALATQTGG